MMTMKHNIGIGPDNNHGANCSPRNAFPPPFRALVIASRMTGLGHEQRSLVLGVADGLRYPNGQLSTECHALFRAVPIARTGLFHPGRDFGLSHVHPSRYG